MQLSEAAYKGLKRADLEYGRSVWDPHVVLQVELEHVQADTLQDLLHTCIF